VLKNPNTPTASLLNILVTDPSGTQRLRLIVHRLTPEPGTRKATNLDRFVECHHPGTVKSVRIQDFYTRTHPTSRLFFFPLFFDTFASHKQNGQSSQLPPITEIESLRTQFKLNFLGEILRKPRYDIQPDQHSPNLPFLSTKHRTRLRRHRSRHGGVALASTGRSEE